MLKNKSFNPLLKWRGGKTSDIKYLRKINLLPKTIKKYYEPFLGGGAFWLSVDNVPMFVNDICKDLINFYHSIKSQDDVFFSKISEINEVWNFLGDLANKNYKEIYYGELKSISSLDKIIIEYVRKKIIRINNLDKKNNITLDDKNKLNNVEGSLKAGYYTYIRSLFNKENETPHRNVYFYLLREYSFSAMFRYNKEGDFNVPYGGISYNKRQTSSKIELLEISRFN